MALYFPETKGLTLEEVGALFGDEIAEESSSPAASEVQGGVEKVEGKAYV
jgi:hypothetical protein